MAMLYPEEFWRLHGFGAKVYDATGRELRYVCACDPLTGEVIMCCFRSNPLDWIRWRLKKVTPRLRWDWIYRGELPCRHGFWPAPFMVVPPRDAEQP